MGFTTIPDWLTEEKILTKNDVFVYAILLRFQGKNEHAWPSLQKMAKLALLDERSVRRSLTKLESLNWIEKTRFGRGKTNRYRCLRASPDTVSNHSFITGQVVQSRTDTVSSYKPLSPDTVSNLSSGSFWEKTTTPMGGEVFQLILNLIEKRTYYEVDDVEKSVVMAVDKYASRHGLTIDHVEPVVNGVIDDWGSDASKIKSIGRVLFHRLKLIYDPR